MLRGVLVLTVIVFGLAPAAAAQGSEEEEAPATIEPEASSSPGDEAARVRYQAARDLYVAGRYEEAAEEFTAAYELSGRPEMLYNMFLAHRDGGDLERATDALREYIRTEENLPEDQRAQLGERLRSLERQLEEQRETERRAREGTVIVEESPVPLIVLISGGALLLGGGVMAVLTHLAERDLEDRCPMNLCPPDVEVEDEKDRGKTFAAITDGLLLAGAVASVTGLILLLTQDTESDAAPERPDVAFGCGPSGCVGSLRAPF